MRLSSLRARGRRLTFLGESGFRPGWIRLRYGFWCLGEKLFDTMRSIPIGTLSCPASALRQVSSARNKSLRFN
jgi:hypothetical protein